MNKYDIIKRIEAFAPVETQEKWDCSGWAVETSKCDVTRVMLALTVTEDVVNQAKLKNCDMIISHHPLFCVPREWKDIDIYCAHTNLDKANGGTTDTLIENLSLKIDSVDEFVRYVNIEISLEDMLAKLKKISPNLRYVNNHGVKFLKRIAFCAGSGSEFIREAYENGAGALVTGDLKFHTALESLIVVFDIGHFESEVLVLSVFKKLIGSDVEIFYAKEKSPFLQI